MAGVVLGVGSSAASYDGKRSGTCDGGGCSKEDEDDEEESSSGGGGVIPGQCLCERRCIDGCALFVRYCQR